MGLGHYVRARLHRRIFVWFGASIVMTGATVWVVLTLFSPEASEARVVDEGTVITAGGVTAGIDLGVHLVARLVDDVAAEKVAAQMAFRRI